MSSDYDALKKFVREEILDSGLEINHLRITHSAITSITRRFEEFGWSVEAPPGTRNRNTIVSPDSNITLSMADAKVFRHPKYTDQICKRKNLTKRMLDLDRVPTPVGADFSSTEKEIASALFEKMPKPAVVKPTDSGGSRGVTVGVTSQSEFERAWYHALAEGRSDSNIIIEQFVRGVELRAFVIGDQVVSIVARIQPFVTGTAHSTIETLIAELHDARQVNYRTMKMPVVVDWDFVAKQGHRAASIPLKDEIVFLNRFSLPTVGAFVVDVTATACLGIKNIAKRAKDAIPGLEIAGVDILVEDLRDESTAYVLEVNTAATPELHRYPTHGAPRPLDHDIVNYFHAKYEEINKA